MSSLQDRLAKIRSSPKLQNQQQTAVVLTAIEDTLRTQNSSPTPTAYFAALLSLLGQYVSSEKGITNKEVAYAVVYLLDLVTKDVPTPLLRSKFPQILGSLAPALTQAEQAEAPLLRAAIGCLEALLVAQDSLAWGLPLSQSSPRGAVGGLLALAMDQRPKVRRRAQDALANVLRHPPPSPSLDHPVAEMCAESALRSLQVAAEETSSRKRKQKNKGEQEHEPSLMHALQLVKTIASAENGWPSKKIDALCSVLLDISRSSNEFLTMAAFEVFEIIFAGLVEDEVSSAKLPKVLEAIEELQPAQNDSQLLPPWIAVLSRGYDVAAQVEPAETFEKLPGLVGKVSAFLTSSSHNIRISASECLISLLHTCIPKTVLLEPSIMDEKLLENLGRNLQDLLSVKYQTAWMEVFNVLTAAFEKLRWRAYPLLSDVVKSVGDLRSNDSFSGKKEADAVISAAIRAMGPDNVLAILPLNLAKPVKGEPGRAWLLPLMRDSVTNTRLAHFRTEMVPLSETMFQRVLNHGNAEKTMDIKIYETVVAQIWASLPGYCELPLDLREAFDQSFAEMLSNLLYQQPQLRTDICRGLQNLVESNKAVAELEIGGEEAAEDMIQQGRVTKDEAKRNLEHLAGFAANVLAVLFNVYSQTLPHNRGNLLQCINAYLSITPEQELMDTFQRVGTMLESSIADKAAEQAAEKDLSVTQKRQQQKSSEEAKNKMPHTSHTLMDLVITMSIYLPRQSFAGLFTMAANIVGGKDDPQLQKKAYKLIPRLAEAQIGREAIRERNVELQELLVGSAEKASAPAKRDRIESIARVVPALPREDLHFIPSVLSEVVIGTKEVNEKARLAAFDLLVLMSEKMSEGGTIVNAKVPGMAPDVQNVEASLEEYFTMVSAGLADGNPKKVSASITALTRLLYEFRLRLKQETIVELVQTMDLFLTSNNREIVRSVLGFVKVCVISLPTELMLPRLGTLVPNLVGWSHEHKAHFKAKVKHILERMIRRYGVEAVEQSTPLEDRKLIANIRKTRERRKRGKMATANGDEGDGEPERRRGKFESEYDEAVYGSESEEGSGSDISDDEVLGRAVAKGQKTKQGKGKQYIVEDEDEPLDLLGKKALAHVSSTKPAKTRAMPDGRRNKAKIDLDGKLVFNEDADGNDNDGMHFDDQGMMDGQEPGDGSLEGGINAYVNAIKGKDVAQRGQRGKLKFRSEGRKGGGGEDAMEIDQEDADVVKRKINGVARGRGGGMRGGGMRGGGLRGGGMRGGGLRGGGMRGGGLRGGGMSGGGVSLGGRGGKQKPMRRGLGGEKVSGADAGDGIRKARGRTFKHGLQRRGGKR